VSLRVWEGVCVFVCLSVQVCVYMRVYACVCVCWGVCVCLCTCVCLCLCMCVCVLYTARPDPHHVHVRNMHIVKSPASRPPGGSACILYPPHVQALPPARAAQTRPDTHACAERLRSARRRRL